MYKIIGADQKEYGPVSAEQLHQWLAEGRVNVQTQVLPEGATQWVTLGSLPEFAGALAASAPAITVVPAPGPGAAELVKGPATGLIVVAVLGADRPDRRHHHESRGRFVHAPAPDAVGCLGEYVFGDSRRGIGGVIGILLSGLIFIGAMKMKKLESHGLAVAASIVAMIPCLSPCCLLGLPIGIWAAVVLFKPEVKSAVH